MRLLGSNRIRTTAYHPAANGLVERLHRQLKAALSAVPQTQWLDALPLVLLGIRSCFEEDIHCTTSELVYGTTLHLPGEFFDSTASAQPVQDPHTYVSHLRSTMQQLHPISASHHTSRTPHICKDLATSTHIFIRHDAVHKSLQPPFEVIAHTDKFYTVLVNGHQQTISLDQLNISTVRHLQLRLPLLLPASSTALPTKSSTPQVPVRTTRSGRHVHFPERYTI